MLRCFVGHSEPNRVYRSWHMYVFGVHFTKTDWLIAERGTTFSVDFFKVFELVKWPREAPKFRWY